VKFLPSTPLIWHSGDVASKQSSAGTHWYGGIQLAQQYVFESIKPGYMFQLYSHHQAYLQSLVELYILNAYVMLDPNGEATIFTDGIKNMNHSAGLKQGNRKYIMLRKFI
jgi:hypothetical protein